MTKLKFLCLFAVALLQLWTVKASAIVETHWTGSTVESIGANQKVMLFNLGTGKWLGRGGTWGVEAIQSEMPMPMTMEHWTNDTTNQVEYRFRTTFQQRETSGSDQSAAYMSLADHHKTSGDWYIYLLDRSYENGLSNDSGLCNFTFEKVVDEHKNIYRIKRRSYEKGDHQEWGKTKGSFTPGVYVMAAQYNPKSSDVDGASQDNCINAFLEDESGSTGITDGSDEWLLVTEDEVKTYYSQVTASYNAPAPSTFLIKDYDFARNDNEVTNYKRADGTDLQLGDNLAKDNNSTDATTNFQHNPSDAKDKYTYYVGNGIKTFNSGWGDTDHGQEGSGYAWTANIHGTSGKIYQNVDGLFRDGWYEIRVNAFTTKPGSAKLYASVGNATTNTSVLTNYQEATIATASWTPTTYVQANNMVDTIITDEDGTEKCKYQEIVRVYVPANANGYDQLQFGVKVDNADADSWTCLDNFQLYYLGTADKVVILDEDKTSMDYINTQNTEMAREKKAVVYLHRELKANTWSSLVLPFDMDANTVKSIFGTNTIISEFRGAINADYPERMYFVETDEIKKDKLYIIRPEVEPAPLPARVTAKDDGTNESRFTNIYLDKDTKAYVVTGVVFGRPTTGEGIFPSDGKISGPSGAENYGDGNNVHFAGSYLSDTYSQNNTGDKQIPANSYVIAGNTASNHTQGLWYYRKTKTTPAKGFRGWLEVNRSTNAKLSFDINGVLDNSTVTAIDGISYDGKNSLTGNGVYNLNGQRIRTDNNLQGLKPGLYIVGGKKYVVR